MPSHQPLRDRCNVPQSVCTDRRTSRNKDQQLSHAALRRRLSIQEVPRTPRDPHGTRQFVPYLYLFSPSAPGVPPPPGNWTHTLRLLPPSKTRPTGCNDFVGSTRVLDLHIPAAAFKGSRGLHLSTQHLLLARDFLSLALPYFTSAHPPSYFTSPGDCEWPASAWSPAYTPISHVPLEGMGGMMPQVPPLSQADPVRVLVLGPPRLVLAISLVYVAHASGCSVAQVVRGVLESDGDGEWCRLIGDAGDLGLTREEMKTMDRAAMTDM
ncbi:hypothetical protein DFH06DRAFT_1243851 [Mycena polygramma]|nr:hypothetical protein DFH06DRAFT_1243851 [Mycena polygramma]